MPPQLLSPAGLPACELYNGGARQSAYLSMEEQDAPSSSRSRSGRQYLDVSRGLPGAGLDGESRRPPIKRTASTASVNEHIMDMLNPSKQAEEIARMNSSARKGRSDSVGSSLESEDGIGTLEDWEIEHDSPEGSSSSSNKHQLADDPFRVSHPPSGSSSSMMLDAPPSSSSPTPAPALRSKSKHSAAVHAMESDDDMDDADNNPFLDAPRKTPSAPSKSRVAGPKDKISYVFRGKRITYDAPLESLYADDTDGDEDEASLQLNSGPRVLFPAAPPTPVASDNNKKHIESSPRKSALVSPERRPAVNMHLMQTPRRPSTTAASSSSSSDMTLVGTGGGERKKYPAKAEQQEPIRFIPPTPASLPQKSQKTDEQRRMERERLRNAMRGIQAAHQAVHAAHRGDGAAAAAQSRQRRYAPYPPR